MMLGLVGQELGQYHIEQKINEGAMAAIFRAYQPSLKRHVAIKVLPPAFVTQDSRFAKRFQREANLIARLDHPNIVPVYDFGIEGNYSYIVMRYVPDGFTLNRLMLHPLDCEQALALISQIARGLNYAHQRGIIHRDVKPGNVLVDGDWLLLSDFGLAKLNEVNTDLTEQGTRLGTPLYMSPEQLLAQPIDHRTDIYALGVILYKMLTGHIPHQADNYWSLGLKRRYDAPISPRRLDPTIPAGVEQVILRTLATRPEDRYDNALDFIAALQEALQDDSYREPLPDRTFTPIHSALTRPDHPEKSSNWIKNHLIETVPSYRKALPRWFGWTSLMWLILGIIIAFGGILWSGGVFNPVIHQPSPTQPPIVALVVSTPSRTPTLTPSPTDTPILPTPTPSFSPSLALTNTPIPATVTPTSTPVIPTTAPIPTPTITPIPTPTLPTGTFTLLSPLSLEEPSYGLTDFEWEWVGSLPPEFGFEVRVWREGEFPAGVHNAIEDNQSGQIERIGENRYRLHVNIQNAAGVNGRRGEYWWTVALVQIRPTYIDLEQQAQPARLRFEPVGGRSGSNNDGDSQGDGNKGGYIK
jgi:serine/threonine-protein kinase